MLRAIVFICGAALMALELVAARVLAPALGNSIFVWGSVISVVMLALSLGYWVGGQLADRVSAARALSPLIAGAGLLTVLAPLIAAATLPWAADLGPRLGSLAASTAIFFLPALLLATVSPLAVRLVASDGLERIGRSAGSLYAISTAGSIAGTLATAFWLIPALSLSPLIVAIGFTLFACSLAALALPRLTRSPADDSRALPTGPGARVSRPVAAALAIVVAGAVA
jgi:predicted membrane-bound spermidine synthase